MRQALKALIARNMPLKCYYPLQNVYHKCRYFLLFPLYIGDQFECPFCGGHFRKFLAVGQDLSVVKEKKIVSQGYHPNAICPRCHSLDRDRLVYLYIKNKTNLFQTNQKLRLLHVAPERNVQKVFKSYSHIDYLSADLESPLAMVKMDITDIRHNDNSFDIVVCCHVLEHIPNDRKAMSELYRVLKPGGWAILQVPISLLLEKTYEDPTIVVPKERERAFGQRDHVRIYARDYKDRLESIGFSVEVYSFAEEFGESVVRRYGLLKHEDMYICSKPTELNPT